MIGVVALDIPSMAQILGPEGAAQRYYINH